MQRTLFDAETQPKLARDTDKATSHAAAADVAPKLGVMQSRCLSPDVFDSPRMTANEIAANAAARFGGMAETYRKRVHEIVRAGLLREAGETICSVTGKGATVYEMASISSRRPNV